MIIATSFNQEAYLASKEISLTPEFGVITETQDGYAMNIRVDVPITNLAGITLQDAPKLIVPYIRQAVGSIKPTEQGLEVSVQAYSQFWLLGGDQAKQAAYRQLQLAKTEKDWAFSIRVMLKDYLLAQIAKSNTNPLAMRVAKTIERLERAKQLVTI